MVTTAHPTSQHRATRVRSHTSDGTTSDGNRIDLWFRPSVGAIRILDAIQEQLEIWSILSISTYVSAKDAGLSR